MTNTAKPVGPDAMPTRRSFLTMLAVVGLSAVAGFAFVYAMVAQPGAPAPSVPAAKPSASAAGPNKGAMTAFVIKKEPEALPAVAFTDGAGKPMTLGDLKGRIVLLNLWATWCAPCRKEMPALERLQKELGSDRFEVVALSVDRGGIEASKKFLDQIKVSALKLYVDGTGRASSTLKAVGLPTTLLLDKEGREIGRLVGPAEWDSEDAKHLVRHFGG